MIKNAIELSGRYLNSMVRAMHEFKELGEAVLSRYHVRHIDLDAYYLASMRRDMLTQVRDRFGDEGVMYVAIEGVKDLVDSIGVYRFPVEEAAVVTAPTLFAERMRDYPMLIRMVFLEPNITQSYKEAFDKLVQARPEK